MLRFESVIHEFDPYFNYRTTKYLAEQGFYSFHNWFDDRAWYPLGRIIGGDYKHVVVQMYCDVLSKSVVYLLLVVVFKFKTHHQSLNSRICFSLVAN